MRLLLARVLPGSSIRIHRDQGGYVERGHRIHIPLQADSSTLAFLSCPTAVPHAISPSVTASEALGQGCLPLQIEEGLVRLLLAPAYASQENADWTRTFDCCFLLSVLSIF